MIGSLLWLSIKAAFIKCLFIQWSQPRQYFEYNAIANGNWNNKQIQIQIWSPFVNTPIQLSTELPNIKYNENQHITITLLKTAIATQFAILSVFDIINNAFRNDLSDLSTVAFPIAIGSVHVAYGLS